LFINIFYHSNYRSSSTSSALALASESYFDFHARDSPLALINCLSRSKRASDSSSSWTLTDSNSTSTECKLDSKSERLCNIIIMSTFVKILFEYYKYAYTLSSSSNLLRASSNCPAIWDLRYVVFSIDTFKSWTSLTNSIFS